MSDDDSTSSRERRSRSRYRRSSKIRKSDSDFNRLQQRLDFLERLVRSPALPHKINANSDIHENRSLSRRLPYRCRHPHDRTHRRLLTTLVSDY